MFDPKPDDNRHDEDVTKQEHIHRLLSLQKHRKVNKRTLLKPQKIITQRHKRSGPFQGVQGSNIKRGRLSKGQPLPHQGMHRRRGGVQDGRPRRKTRLDNSQLPVGSEIDPRRWAHSHPANRRLSLGVDFDQEGRLWKIDEGALAETAEVQVQQVQHRQGVQLSFILLLNSIFTMKH